ncbi:TadE/TadG family type IV pilus assembly protein [Marimonas sp. MJW-29]|uniref:TadE/TadG family type IV pilus assembly protein n=1 Tax=Sulfitobacter sediminis TaxID=3234186 RepID=A0ABV3RPZ3_9RHOB
MVRVQKTASESQLAPVARLKRFWRDEAGNATIESIIWFPIFAILLAFIMNVSIVFFTESQMLRVVQDGNRAFSLGRLADAQEVQNYILTRLSYLEANLDISTNISDGFVMTSLKAPAGDLMPLNFMNSAFNGITINVSAQQIVEF